MKSRTFPHLVLVWHIHPESRTLTTMRLVTAAEYEAMTPFLKQALCWKAYSPEGSAAGPGDLHSTEFVDQYGIEALIFEVLSSRCVNVVPNVMQEIQLDLRRLGISPWADDEDRFFLDSVHRNMGLKANYSCESLF